MRHIGFVRPVTIGKFPRAIVAHHEVVEMPENAAALLKAEHGDAIADLTPKEIGYQVSVPRRMSTIRVVGCPECRGERRMTVCRLCKSTGKVLVV